MLRRITIRVYGLLLNDREEVLLSDEIIRGNKITKFPGGGLQLGEGPSDCLVREFKEEIGKDIVVSDHFYTTDFFQQSYFDDETQVISLYYRVICPDWQSIPTQSTPFDYRVIPGSDAEAMRWASIDKLDEEVWLTLPIDKKVAALLMVKGSRIGFKM